MDRIPQECLEIPGDAMYGDSTWCAAGPHCMVQNGPAVPRKHHCPICFCHIHAICGVVNMETDDILFSSVCQCCVMLSAGGNTHIGEQQPRPPPVAQWPPAQPEQVKKKKLPKQKQKQSKNKSRSTEKDESSQEECCSG